MTEQIWVALIGAAALLAAGYLGYSLRGRSKRSDERRENLRVQLDRVYGPLYDLLKNAGPPDEPLSEIDLKEVERIIKIATANRKFLDRRLETIIDSILEGLYSHGEAGVDLRDLEALSQHVHHRYNDLRKALGLPHTPHWLKRDLRELHRELRSRWWFHKWEREKRRRTKGRPDG